MSGRAYVAETSEDAVEQPCAAQSCSTSLLNRLSLVSQNVFECQFSGESRRSWPQRPVFTRWLEPDQSVGIGERIRIVYSAQARIAVQPQSLLVSSVDMAPNSVIVGGAAWW